MNNMKILRTAFLAVAALSAASTSSLAAEFYLRADVTTKTMPDSTAITLWGFALENATFDAGTEATVPGPILVVPPGETTLTIHLKNNLTVERTGLSIGCPVSLVIPGQIATMTPVKFGAAPYPQFEGRVRSLTHETPPDNATVVDYVWNNVKPGTYVYHSGTHIQCHVQMGLYGGVIKDYDDAPYKQAYPNVVYETGVPVFFSEIDPAFHAAVASNNYGPDKPMTSTIDYEPKYFLINGEPFVASQALLPAGAHGGGTLLRFFNMGLETRCPLLQGSYMTLIAEDGRPYKYPKEQYVASLPAGKTLDAIVAFPSAATYPLYDRRLGLTNALTTGGGMLKRLEVATGSFWPVIASITATPPTIPDTQPTQLLASVTDADTDPASLTYAWEVPPGAGSLDSTTIANPVFTPAFTATKQTHTLTVVVSDGADVDIGVVDVTVTPTPPPVEVIVDNLDAGASSTGSWYASTQPNPYGTDSMTSLTFGSTFTFAADLVPATAYAVYAWWTEGPERYTAVPCEIRSGGTLLDTINVNQTANGGQWNPLGVYVFDGAASVTVVTAAPGGTMSTNADAVKFVRVVLEGLEITGPATVDENATVNYDALAHYSGGLSLAVQPQVWTVDAAEATIDATGQLTAAPVTADTPAVVSAQYTLNGTTVSDTHSITILNSGALPPEVIVDNLDAGASSTGSWFQSGASNPYGANSMASLNFGSTFTFTADLVPGTAYAVYAWWTDGGNRYTAVPYQIRDGGTLLDTITVNQFVNGGQWNPLGVYIFSGTASVTVVSTAPGGTSSTCADAVRFVPVVVESLEITGPATVNESSTANYDAVAHCAGGLLVPVQPQMWTVDVAQATIDATGQLTAASVTADTPAAISAEYSLNGTTVSDTHSITILNSAALPPEVIVDNLAAGTSSTGSWFQSGAANPWATNSVASLATGSTFTFTANLVPGTSYAVYAWWTDGGNRYTAVPYQIRDGGTLLDTVTVNQFVNGGQWNLLGTYTFSATTNVTVVAAAPGWTFSTCADAVQFVPVP